MKSNILKFTTAVMAVSLVAVSPQVHAMNHEQEQFVGSMVQEIGQTMFSLLDLLKNFVTKSNTQKLAAYTKALSEQVIKASALNTKLKAEMDAIAASAPGSEYHKILQAMYAYSSLAHTQLMNFFTSLDTFSRSAGKKPADLLLLLKNQLTAVKAVEADFERKLNELELLLKSAGQAANASKIITLKSDVAVKANAIKNEVGANLITICKFRMS